MGNRGPAPKPTALKVLEGNPGKRALNTNEPRVDQRKPTCPKWMKGEARREWDRVSKVLHQAGLLTFVDRAVLAMYCQAWDRWVRAEKALDLDALVEETDKGYKYVNPMVGVARGAAEDVKKYGALLGMNPSVRSRLVVSAPGEEEESLAATLFRMANAGGEG